MEPVRLSKSQVGDVGNMKTVLREATGYAVVSACAFVIDITALFILVHYLSWWYVAAATISFLVGLLVAYALSVTLVFKYRRLQDPRIEAASFAGIGVVGVAINTAAMTLGVKVFGVHYLIAKCGAAGLTFVWNFVARRQFLFAQRRAA
jgi:putative flippase GtrA